MNTEHHSRQSFLGRDLSRICEEVIVGIIGVGGGGSHIVQQLTHIGVDNLIIVDPDVVETPNMNRLIGATNWDATWHTSKVAVMERMVHAINPKAKTVTYQDIWQNYISELEKCDVIFGCVDGFSERDQLERFTRRFLIPYIDIGLDVYSEYPDPPRMAGQVFVSMPGGPCMRCLGFLGNQDLKVEGERYGSAGKNPQVVWANGVLASSAVGLVMGILTGWHERKDEIIWLSYDGNTGTLVPHVRLTYFNEQNCTHFPITSVGPTIFKKL